MTAGVYPLAPQGGAAHPKSYSVKSLFRSLQGEGFHSGRRAVFCRFAGCNGWSGLLRDRGRGPFGCSEWCDTDFRGTDGPGGGKFPDAVALAAAVLNCWGDQHPTERFVVLTGGEPLLQADGVLFDALLGRGFFVAVETNGTVDDSGLSGAWVTLSPKAGGRVVLRRADEVKLVYPQPGLAPEDVLAMGVNARHRYLQPLWDADPARCAANVSSTVEYVLEHPCWRLSLQAHKIWGLP